MPCVPLDQAREAIPIWLAILATHPSPGELHDGPYGGFPVVEVRNIFVPAWTYPGENDGYLAPPGAGPQMTAAGYVLASAMAGLPQQKVSHVLASAWASWLNWHTTDAQLVAALGIPMPSVPAVPTPSQGRTVAQGPGGQQNPLCTT
jgi:hypothetical protein